MSRYIRKPRCPQCGEPHWFRDWVGDHCLRSRDGLCVTDFDLLFHRFDTVKDKLGTREIEKLMVVEVKVEDEVLRKPQRDSLSTFNGTLGACVPVKGDPIKVKARPGFIQNGEKKTVWLGVHLLRVPRERSDAGPFYWDNRLIAAPVLAGVLNMERDPYWPSRMLDIDRRHKDRDDPLFREPCHEHLPRQSLWPRRPPHTQRGAGRR